VSDVFLSGRTLIPTFRFAAASARFFCLRRENVLDFLQRATVRHRFADAYSFDSRAINDKSGKIHRQYDAVGTAKIRSDCLAAISRFL
jgi:hypothetical protein